MSHFPNAINIPMTERKPTLDQRIAFPAGCYRKTHNLHTNTDRELLPLQAVALS